MSFEFFHAADTGRARSNNEDSVAVDQANGLAVLADGMGGYNAGEVASGMLTDFIRTELGRWLAEAGSRATDAEVKRPPASASQRPSSVLMKSVSMPLATSPAL